MSATALSQVQMLAVDYVVESSGKFPYSFYALL
jgi:hypothetical protein